MIYQHGVGKNMKGKKMNIMRNVTNPVGDGGQSKRLEEIESAYAQGAISHDQYEDLLEDEKSTGDWVFVKRAAFGALCLGIGILFLLS